MILEFIGGYWDGKRLDTDSADPEEASLAQGYLFMTHGGEIGRGFYGLSPEAIAFAQKHGFERPGEAGFSGQHVYWVTDRRESGDEVTIRFKYAVKGKMPTEEDIIRCLKHRYNVLLQTERRLTRFRRERFREVVGHVSWKEQDYFTLRPLSNLDDLLWFIPEGSCEFQLEEGATFRRDKEDVLISLSEGKKDDFVKRWSVRLA